MTHITYFTHLLIIILNFLWKKGIFEKKIICNNMTQLY